METVPLADFAPYSDDIRIAAVEPGDDEALVTWNDGRRSSFHYLWLRDNCHCADCKHPQTFERTFDLLSVPEGIRPAELSVTSNGALRAVWPDGGHESLYHPGWLDAHDYSSNPSARLRPPPELWDAALNDMLPVVDYRDVMQGGAGLLHWLRLLRNKGFSLLRGVPTEPGQVQKVAERVAFARETNFGRVFDVVAMPDPNSNAYTSLALPLHVDLPTREYQPGYQFLHCIQSEAEGGKSVLMDGFAMAERLRREDPAAFDVLAREPILLRFQDADVDYRVRRPLIVLDAYGTVSEIRFSPFLADAFDVTAEKMPAYYRAYRKLMTLSRDPALQLRFRLKPGEMMTFDNRRVLHGRDAFEAGTGARHLQGCYVDHDEVNSKILFLERTMPAPAVAAAE